MRRASAASLLLVTLLVAACGTGSGPSGTTTPGTASAAASAAPSQPAETPSDGAPSDAPETEAPSPSDEPVVTPEPSASETESESPAASESVAPSASASPSSSATAPALACSPEGNNPNFWPGIASSVSWDVYCAVLPKGWHVDSGTYRLANGGWLAITYKGPGGAALALCEGGPFPSGVGCSISGSDSGGAAFGSRAGTLITTDAGGFAIAVDRDQKPTWLMITSGLDQATTLALGAALAQVH